MKIIISPAKKMNINTDSLACIDLPKFINKTEEIMKWIKNLSLEEMQTLWGCNDKIAIQNYERYENMNVYKNLTPAILSYEGIQYQYMAPTVFEDKMLEYIQEHLRILSGFYGILKPMDGVTPYRLEMQAKAQIANTKNLYEYWGNELYREVADNNDVIINLASKEYSKCVEKYLKPTDRFITIVFGEWSGNKIVQKSTYAKMARGEMVRYMAEKGIENPDELCGFDRLGYRYSENMSSEEKIVFVKNSNERKIVKHVDVVIKTR